MPNALSIFTSESQLGLIDFEMALDVEEQARISEQKRFSLDATRNKNGLDFQIYEESESCSGVEEIYNPASQPGTEDSPDHTYYNDNSPASADTNLALQLPLPAKVPDDSYNQSQPTEGNIYTQTQTRTSPTNNDYHNNHPEDQENDIQRQSLSSPFSSPSSSSHNHNSYNPSNPTRTHRRFDSTESYTTHWDNTLLNNKGSNPFTFQARSRYKSPYLGPVGWTVPSRYTSIIRTRVMVKATVTKRRVTSKRGAIDGLNSMIETANGAGPIDLDANDEEGYAGDVDGEAGESHGSNNENDDGNGNDGDGKVIIRGRSRVVCRRCEARPFLIYQDPEWVDVSGVEADPFIHAAASDDKENVDPSGGGGNGDGDS